MNAVAILAFMQPDQAVAQRWTNVALYWEKHRDTIRQLFHPVTQALIHDARIAPGHRVLDIATGPGEPAVTIASHVAPQGRVAGIDLIPEMAAAARRAANRLQAGNAQFCAASALQLPFPAATFDALVSRFGIMFFPSPVDGVREMLRVLKPGGRLALAVWDFADANPFFYTMSRAIERYVASPAIDPDAPDAFRFAACGKLKQVLIEAGVHDPTERVLRFTIGATISVEDYWTLRYEISETTREKLARLSADQFADVKRLAIAAIGEYSTAQGISFPAQVLIVSGSKSR